MFCSLDFVSMNICVPNFFNWFVFVAFCQYLPSVLKLCFLSSYSEFTLLNKDVFTARPQLSMRQQLNPEAIVCLFRNGKAIVYSDLALQYS
jgi:hypothetical protein